MVNPSLTAPIDMVSGAVMALLTEIGFQKHSGDVYTQPMAHNVIGWVGLNRAVRRTDDHLEINPVVGVRYEAVERLVAELCRTRYKQYIPPTASIHLGYLTPERRYRPWLFSSDAAVGRLARDMVDAIVAYGLPFMKRNAMMENLAELLEGGAVGHAEHLAYRVPAVRVLMNDVDGALQALDRAEAALGGRHDPAAESFRSYAARLRERLAADPPAGGTSSGR